jgi:hypothetical protein
MTDFRDVQVVVAFSKEAIENIINPEYIDFTQIKSIKDFDKTEDIYKFAISTTNQDSLVHFSYSLFGSEGNASQGALELIDTNDIFTTFLRQSFLNSTKSLDSKLNIYFIWGYGRDRKNWSLVHKSFITDVNYNIHEGYKVVNIQFEPILVSKKLSRHEIYTRVAAKKPSGISLKSKKGSPSGRTYKDIDGPNNGNGMGITGGISLGKLARKDLPIPTTDDKFYIDLKYREVSEVVADIIETAADECFKLGIIGSKLNIIVDREGIVEALKNSIRLPSVDSPFNDKLTRERKLTRVDLLWVNLCREIGGLDYQPAIENPSVDFNGRFSPGSILSKPDTILPKDQKVQDIENKLNDELKTLKARKKKLLDQEDLFKTKSDKMLYGYRIRPRLDLIDQQVKEKEEEISKLYANSNLRYSSNFPLLVFYKPSNVHPLDYFNKFLKRINIRMKTNIQYMVSDVDDNIEVLVSPRPFVYMWENKMVSTFKGNSFRRLYNPKTGMRKLHSINNIKSEVRKGVHKLIEDENSNLNLSFNGYNSLIEKLSIDINFIELFSWDKSVFNFINTPVREDSDNKTVTFKLKDFKFLADIVFKNSKGLAGVFKNFEDIVGILTYTYDNSEKELDTNGEPIITLKKSLSDTLKDFLNENKATLAKSLITDLLQTESNFLVVNVSLLGIPEIDTVSEVFYGRKVNLSIFDPEPGGNGKLIESFSGEYYIKGFKHEIFLESGYTTYLVLQKALTSDLWGEGDNGLPS